MAIENIEKEVLKWNQGTFPNANLDALTNKFKEELKEFLNEFEKHEDIFDSLVLGEFVDLCIVYISALGRIDYPPLSSIIAKKLEINKARVWGEETANGDRPRIK